ncbi:Cytochrome c (plasmid) [Tautonia plasticadhaerens]|uniref:Cytochrome c n=2 Tax=Tautonia plasticadhaerens TaxID=2527974 RepID=A0A518HEH5_9BACT|nr:Cytochrome c [Tautonia plasticadhaerens]
MIRFSVRLCAIALLGISVSGCKWGGGGGASPEGPGPDRNALVIEDDPFGEATREVAYLDQGWSPRDSQRFYFTSQGTQILPYDWFLVLEQPDGEGLFRDNQYMLRFRFLPQRPDEMNPHGLPVGFVKDEGRDRGWLGITCAACHTTQVDHEGVGYRIDGAPALADVPSFILELTEALEQTREDDSRFDRFAARVLDRDTPGRREVLRRQLDIVIDRREGYNARNFPPDKPAGYGRVDALGAILNEVFHEAVRDEQTPPTANTEPADAPVSYPFLWDTPQHDKVQWVGNVENGGLLDIGSLGRNVGEVLGVFADLELEREPVPPGYRSSVRVKNLRALEDWVRTLWSPQWPDGFPEIDGEKVAAGEALYRQHCLDCHRPIDRTDPGRRVEAVLRAVGTDPRTADNFWLRGGETGKLEGALVKVINPLAGRLGERAAGAAMLNHAVIGTIIGSAFEAPEDALTQVEFGERPVAVARALLGGVYKARPLNGIWATAPYLHNGSVPSLYQLLLPAEERVRSFSVGSRQFDPEHVGFRTDAPGVFQFRTHDEREEPIPGNSNAGHEYGTELSGEERWQLVEYLKTL